MTEQYANIVQTTLNGAITDTDASLVVASATGMPTTGDFRLRIDNEILKCTARAGTTLTVTREAEDAVRFPKAAHADGSVVTVVVTAAAILAIPQTNSGTSFPASPATGDRFWRTDRKIEYFYDGTRWLSVYLYREPLPNAVAGTQAASFSAANSIGRWAPWGITWDLWLEDFWATTFVQTTNDGTKFWTLNLVKYQSNFSTSSTIASFTTAADTANVGKLHTVAIGALLDPTTYVILQVDFTKTSTPGNLLLPAAAISYRLVG